MPRSLGDRYFLGSVLSDSVYRISANQGAAQQLATGQYAVGGLTSGRRVIPTQTSTTSNGPPSVGTAPADQGWRHFTAADAANQVTFAAGAWPVKFRYIRSGGADQSTRVTVILYRVGGDGTFKAEIARESLDVTFTATAQDATFPFAGIAEQVFAADDRLQVEVYLQTLTTGVPTAPVITTTMNLRIRFAEAEPNAAKSAAPDYTTQVKLTQTASVALAAALGRRLELHRSLVASIAPIATLGRAVTYRRGFTAAVTLLASVRRKVEMHLSAALTPLASSRREVEVRRSAAVTLTATARRGVSKRLAANVVLQATMGRVLRLKRAFVAVVSLVSLARATFDFSNVPGGGVIQVIKRVINIWED